MGSRSLLRGFSRSLSTHRTLFNQEPSPNATYAQSLGFTGQSRQRELPPVHLSVSPSSNQAIDLGHNRRQPQPRSFAKNVQQRNPLKPAARDQVQPISESTSEFFEGQELAASVATSSRSHQKLVIGTNDLIGVTASARTQGKRQGGQNRRRQGSNEQQGPTRANRQQQSKVKLPPQRQVSQIPHDSSPRALFGDQSLLSPASRGARDASISFWAKGMRPTDARKADVLRLAGSYDVMTPATVPSKGPAPVKAKSIAAWTLGLNPTIGMRRAAEANNALEGYLG